MDRQTDCWTDGLLAGWTDGWVNWWDKKVKKVK